VGPGCQRQCRLRVAPRLAARGGAVRRRARTYLSAGRADRGCPNPDRAPVRAPRRRPCPKPPRRAPPPDRSCPNRRRRRAGVRRRRSAREAAVNPAQGEPPPQRFRPAPTASPHLLSPPRAGRWSPVAAELARRRSSHCRAVYPKPTSPSALAAPVRPRRWRRVRAPSCRSTAA